MALVPAIAESKPAQAQVNLSQLVTGGFNAPFTATQPRNAQANIVISVRDFSPTDDFCGSSVSFSFARPGSLSDGFDFSHAGRQSIGFPHPVRSLTGSVGGATTYFQLPAGVRNPDLIGCVDTQRNTVFITIKPQRQAAPTQPQPPQPEPSLPPAQTPSMQTPPNRLTPTVPQTQIRLPQQNQSFPAGVSPNNQPIR
ncbi:hypothetical protein [Stenomitos frigidus]|uniref:Uncharacterized protein n=1 Tax=Stenomitos frigidus ULC18 TaxID=2107698 RepID=A0A2T1EBF6_9CYAN|nr:hypothetical protein [Stenomitos frigidus]PSB30079.1 hypothetical protein C7B82_09935 [Stenomitos frigidus ULC18]